MRRILFILILFLILLTACNKRADAEYLMGGNWVATAGYEDGEIKGEPNCNFFEEGLEFKDEEIVYNADFDFDFDYILSDRNGITQITFLSDRAGMFRYYIYIIDENEMGLVLVNDNIDNSCYLERQ